MDAELIDTLKLIIDRCKEQSQGSVFIPMRDFSWYHERNGQLTRLHEAGMIVNLRYYDDGAEITLTQKGKHFFDEQESSMTLNKDKIYEILIALNSEMKIPADSFNLERRDAVRAIKQLQEEGLVSGAFFAEGGQRKGPLTVRLDTAYVTLRGLEFIEEYEKSAEGTTCLNLQHEFISACSKIADNPVSYSDFDEDGLNREIRNYMDSSISHFGYSIMDQTQQGLSEKKPGELDICIVRNGIPVAIYEGLIHSTKENLYDHINKAIEKYNCSGCRAVYVVEYSRNKGFGSFWDNATDALEAYSRVDVNEENTGLLGVRMLKGSFEWEGQKGEFYYIGVNCYVKKTS